MKTVQCDCVARVGGFVFLGTVAFVMGCASPPMMAATAKSCDQPGLCKVVVKVVNCAITMDPDDLHVFHGPQPIMWNIDAASTGAKFTTNGITFKTSNNQFTTLHVAPDGKSAMVIDANDRVGRYDYKVTVADGSAACPPLDPGVINHG